VCAYLREHPCIACGEADNVVLEFSHRDPASKVADTSDMIRRMFSAKRIEAEIAKCDVLCANCHQRLTSLGRGSHYKVRETQRSGSAPIWRQAADLRNRQVVLNHLAGAACVDCGTTDVLVLQFDHREQKANDVAYLVGTGCSPRRLAEELVKCDVRCANCHRRRTAQLGDWFRLQYLQIVDDATDTLKPPSVYRAAPGRTVS
jgi:hypothetical protein